MVSKWWMRERRELFTRWWSSIENLRRIESFQFSEKLPQIGASEAISAATAAASDMGQFCKRQPAACEVGGQAATAIGQRAQDGARQLYKIITDKKPDHTSSIDTAGDAETVPAAAPSTDALTEDDMAVEWRLPRTPLASK